jgi:hypothetical protein
MNAVIEFIVEYDKGVHNKGRKKGQMEKAKSTMTHIVTIPYSSPDKITEYLHSYCRKSNLHLIRYASPKPFNGVKIGEFNCKYCGEKSIDTMGFEIKFCSEYCRSKKLFI